ncbi:DNA (cytosine-5-)-methyltransferase [Paraburkholderia sp. Cpub6]|uniref:DNA (cytosine-5-)-methyltransferase n=1 Tax=Paraburkholderia sp. Cpub6 TaxID=2723094 RepID=UPI0016095C98|nr:DNA (cytosine-5-)-methyltransferase [Paraburkholderia sp. Cpub6]MBB5462340.1 DNA (cytosine-5)-methyltransferase 1 [Paraburkholderia sp. Cpub6]
MSQSNTSKLYTADLFAGVGGFRLALESIHGAPFEFSLSCQWEPSTRVQHASMVYQNHWPGGVHLNEDIQSVLASEEGCALVRETKIDVVCAGFPCQDYSVARPLSQSQGLAGKKGALWWPLAQLLRERNDDNRPVQYLMLENVDRLISSPVGSRGRDFAVILSTLRALGYAAEWRVLNSAEYGHAQRRKRVYICAYHESTGIFQKLRAATLEQDGTPLAQTLLYDAFPCTLVNALDAVQPALSVLPEPLNEQLAYRPLSNGRSRFGNIGLMLEGAVYTCAAKAATITDFTRFTGHHDALTLGDVVRQTGLVPSAFYIKPEDEARWLQAKAAKVTPRQANGFEYNYSEGAMSFPDSLDRPSRTIITSEGGTTPSRTKHAIRDASGRLRRLTPEELESLNGFPRGFTELQGVSDAARARLMGNALVVPMIQRIGEALHSEHQKCLTGYTVA